MVDAWPIDASGGLPAYSAQEARLLSVVPFMVGAGASLGVRSGVRLSGSGTDLLVQAQSSPNMSVKVNPGIFIAQGSISALQGAYTWALDAVTTVPIAASHATLDRTDLIVVRIRDANVDTSGQRDGNVDVIPGTAGGGVPALPTDASYYVIAQISVPHTVTNIGGGGGGVITDKRPFTCALGGEIPFVSTARPTGNYTGQPGWEIDTGLAYRYNATLTKWLRLPVTLRVAADIPFTSNTTLQNDPTLLFAGEASAIYDFDLDAHWIGATGGGGYRPAIAFPAGARIDYARITKDSGGNPLLDCLQNVASGFPTICASAVAGNFGVSRFTGTIAFGGTPGNFQYQASQASSNAVSSWTLIGSTLTYRQTG